MATDFLCTSTEPVVATKAGKLRGFRFNGIYTFYGVDYAKAERFKQPVPVAPWEGVKDALSYGYIAYPESPDSPNGDLFVPHRFWPKSEDCLNLNVWTPTLDSNAKKAVMVWFHGGGFSSGSAVEMLAYDGHNLAADKDVVMVTVNHRLNVFGFLDVSAYGPEYANSQNAGIADLVASLQWVHDNIAAFGGDPENVTIFGQSGGGMKVSSLMQIKAAEGLFQKAIIMSGSGPNEASLSYASNAPIAEKMLKELGSDNIQALLDLEPLELQALAKKVVGGRGGRYWGPLENDWFDHIIFRGSTENAKKIPLLIGTCIGEMGTFRFSVKNRQNLTKEEKEAVVFEKFGEEKGRELLDLFYKAYPDHDAIDSIILDDGSRETTRMMLDLRAGDGSCASYNYVFAYDFPVDDGKAAWHCSDIPFIFRNIDRVAVCNESEVGCRLQEQFSTAWTNFAKTGDPNNEYMPAWEPYTKGHEVTMVIDRTCEARVDFDRELVATHKKLEYEIEHPNMLM